jgi:hypothetical protein
VVATRESATQPWTYLPGRLSADRSKVTFTTRHFSFFGILGYDLGQLVSAFKSDFVDGLTSEATATIGSPPSCDREADARKDGYKISSDSGDTMYWCFGVEGGHRVLKVTDHRRYPLEVAHPNMSVLHNSYDRLQLSALSRLVSGQHAIIEPGGTATFNADLSPGGNEGIATESDSTGQSFYALQVGVETLVSILTRFGAGSGVKALDKTGDLLTARSCLDSLGKGSGALISGCFNPTQIMEAFGVKGLLLAPIMAVGGVLSFFRGEWNALVDTVTGHDQYRINIRNTTVAQVLLGMPWAPYQKGFGTVAPHDVFNGGDPTGYFTITWDSWGGPTADGHGTALWAPDVVADGTTEPASFRAYDLGTCKGKKVYLHLAVWFPQHGQRFDPPNNGETSYRLCPR